MLEQGLWPPQDSGEAAAWAQAIGVLVTVVGGGIWNGYLVWARRRDRAAGAEVAARLEPTRVSAWAMLPRNHARYPQRPRSVLSRTAGAEIEPYERGTWVVDGAVVNGSDTVIWDLVASLVAREGARLPVPAVTLSALPPGDAWPVAWSMGRSVQLYASESSILGPAPLPTPRGICDPDARPQLKLYFTDSAGRRWSRTGGDLKAEVPGAGAATDAEILYSRGLELLDGVDAEAQPPEGARSNFLEALSLAVREATGRTNLLYNTAHAYLAHEQARLRVMAGFTQAGNPNGVYAIAGAFHELAMHKTVDRGGGTITQEHAQQLGLDRLSRHVCAILVALQALASTQSSVKSQSAR